MARDVSAEKHDRRVASEAKKRGASKRGGGNAAMTVTLDGVSWVRLAALTQATMHTGGAVRLGLTRDGGALSVGMYVGEDYGTEYIRPSEDLGEALWEIAEAWLPQGGLAYDAAFDHLAASIIREAATPAKRTDKGT